MLIVGAFDGFDYIESIATGHRSVIVDPSKRIVKSRLVTLEVKKQK